MMYRVIKTDGETGERTQVGGAVKTSAKADSLRQRMRAQQPLGGSSSFTIELAVKGDTAPLGRAFR